MQKTYKYQYPWRLETKYRDGHVEESWFRTKKAAMECLENLCKTYQGLESKLIDLRKEKEEGG